MTPDESRLRSLYKKLLTFYPRDFYEQVGVSMEQTFVDLYRERIRARAKGMTGFVLWMLIESSIGIFKEQFSQFGQGVAVKTILTRPRSAAIISFVICLPFAVLIPLLNLNIEPNFGPLQLLLNNSDPHQPDIVGSLIVLGTFLLVLAAFIINLNQIMRTKRAGGSAMTHPENLVLAVTTLAAVVFVLGSIIVDQYPCWIGVPNCD